MTEVSLVVTVRNEADAIRDLLSSIDSQARAPDEVVIVDGGSTDDTMQLLREWPNPKRVVLQEPGANIARGRNIAIGKASSPLIAVTDAGCVLDEHWLERLVPALDGADVAMGYYEPIATTAFERITTCLTLPDADEIDADRFMPSSRSIAFKKAVWERVGGYPDGLGIGEDMAFNFAVLSTDVRRVFVPDAIVRWHTRPTLGAFLRQYFRYARGDAIGGMYPRRHALRFGSYAVSLAIIVLSLRWPWLVAIPIAGIGFWLRPAYRRAIRRLRGDRFVAFVAMPLLLVVQDAAKMAGYIAGLPHRRPKR